MKAIRRFYLITIVFSAFGIPNLAKGADPSGTFPVIGHEFNLDPQQRELYEKKFKVAMATAAKEKKVGDSTPGQVASLVKDLRASICEVLKKGDEFRFNMAWDASAKAWGIGVGGSTGIEVVVRCEK